MTTDFSKLESLMEQMRTLGLAELHFEEGDTIIHLTNDAHSPHAQKPEVVTPASESGNAQHTITATMHGQFYTAPSPDEPPFVQPGETVKAGETLYILEVMKTLSRIDADFPCRILSILQADGQSVEPGTPLFMIETLDA